jgi:hypothetical protein
MSRGTTFATLDMPEAALCAMALAYELKALRQMAARQQISPDLQASLDRSEALYQRLAKRLAAKGIKV